MLEISFGVKISEEDLIVWSVSALVIIFVAYQLFASPPKKKSMRVYHVHFLVERGADNQQHQRHDLGDEMAWDFNDGLFADESEDEGVADL